MGMHSSLPTGWNWGLSISWQLFKLRTIILYGGGGGKGAEGGDDLNGKFIIIGVVLSVEQCTDITHDLFS